MIVCDKCGATMIAAKIQVIDRVLEKDEAGNPVLEEFFNCQYCGEHYNITFIDWEVRGMIRQRQQIRRKLEKLSGGGKKKIGQYERLLEQDKALKQKQMERVNMLKAKYLK